MTTDPGPQTARPRAQALLVEDEGRVREVLRKFLERLGCEVVEAACGAEALQCIEARPFDVALVDVHMPDIKGTEVTRHAKRLRPELHVVIITGKPDVDTARQAFKQGADDFLPKPITLDQLRVILDQLPVRPCGGDEPLPWVVGTSPAMRAAYRNIRRVAATDETVLILGESGTGKELAARAIHFWSQRRKKPFVPVNCSSVADGVLENELFGHESEAFTGANARRKGLIEEADGGTLFLDEIGDAELPLQAALLRFLQQGEVRRLGSAETLRVNVRVIAATNTDLEREVSEGRFRKDLYYRLNVFPVEMPPLRERLGDIPVLLSHLLERCGAAGRAFADDAVRALQRCRWPGNVRELENLVRRLLVQLPDAAVFGADQLPSPYRGSRADQALLAGSFREAKEVFERQYMETLLQRAGGNVAEAARQAKLGRPYLHEKLRKFGIDPDLYRDRQQPPIA